MRYMVFILRHCDSNYFQQIRHFHKTICTTQETRFVTAAEKLVQEKWELKMKFWMRKYEDLFGITQLSELHTRVLAVQEKIQTIQEKRRKVQEEIFIAQKKLQESQDILHKTSMGDDMYITLVTQVRELLKEQRQLKESFSLYDQTEREHQMTLALAINSSQDHERTYREKNKYLSLITGVVGGLLGLLGSSINNWRHRKDIKLFASDISHQVSDLQKHVEKLNFTLLPGSHLVTENMTVKNESVLSQLKLQQEKLEEGVENLETLLNNKILIDYNNTEDIHLDMQTKQLLHNLEANLDTKLKLHTSINIGLISSFLILGSFLLYISYSH